MPTTNIASKLYYSLVEAQIATGISQWTWRELVQVGKVSCIRANRRTILIPVAEIERIMQERYQPRKEA